MYRKNYCDPEAGLTYANLTHFGVFSLKYTFPELHSGLFILKPVGLT
jgi:hypothetical protein